MKSRLFLTIEMILLYAGLPLLLLLTHAPRAGMLAVLVAGTIYTSVWLPKQPDFSWRKCWHGVGWPRRDKAFAAARFLLLLIPLTGLTFWIDPALFLSFPRERPEFWLIVMLLYPLLSALPQEFLYRTFFFARYATLLPSVPMKIAINAAWFAFAHIMFHNWVAPSLCLIGGAMFGLNYERHRSLKWVAIEHAAYGCAIFTLGLGRYFFHSAIH